MTELLDLLDLLDRREIKVFLGWLVLKATSVSRVQRERKAQLVRRELQVQRETPEA